MTKPWAVCIADVHYSLATLPLADAAMRQAIKHAEALRVPLIVAGDLHDTKGAMRAECVNAMIQTFSEARCQTYVMVGNHDRINEKDKPHALTFLGHLVNVVSSPICLHGLYLVPYESDASILAAYLRDIPACSTLIMHTGLQSAYMGHYTQDKTSLPKETYHGLRVISGHYHRRQDIEIPGGTFSYIGNPYTLTFGEALDPPKGFQVLNTDGTLTFVPTNLRKHIEVSRTHLSIMDPIPLYSPGDLVKIKVSGPKSELDKLDRNAIGEALLGHSNYRLDLVPDKSISAINPPVAPVADTMDTIIDGSGETTERKQQLKDLWRSLV